MESSTSPDGLHVQRRESVAPALGIPATLALLAGIALVVVPIELGYLLYQGKQKTGRWSVWEVVEGNMREFPQE